MKHVLLSLVLTTLAAPAAFAQGQLMHLCPQITGYAAIGYAHDDGIRRTEGWESSLGAQSYAQEAKPAFVMDQQDVNKKTLVCRQASCSNSNPDACPTITKTVDSRKCYVTSELGGAFACESDIDPNTSGSAAGGYTGTTTGGGTGGTTGMAEGGTYGGDEKSSKQGRFFGWWD